MPIQKWDPWRDLARMQEEMSKTLERAFRGQRGEGFWLPEADIYEKGNNLIVQLELPEVKPEDVNITITNDQLRVTGERKQEEEIKEENYYRMERKYGSFERVIELPIGVKTDQVDASYREGVLTITLPKSEAKKGKEIKVRVA